MINKLTLLFFLLAKTMLNSYSSGIHIKTIITSKDGPEEIDISNNADIEIPAETKSLNAIILNCKDLPANHVLKISAVGITREYNIPNKELTISFPSDLLNNEITIQHFDDKGAEIVADVLKFRFISEIAKKTDPPLGGVSIQASIDDFLQVNYAALESTPFGLIDPTDKECRIHIFFDYMGNSLLSTIPQGISNAQYVIHIIYPFTLADPNKLSYTVKQKTGTFSSALLFNNANIRSQIPGQLQSGEKYDGIRERKLLLGTSTDDLTFDIIVASKDQQINKVVIETYTIKMSPVYHGSFDIGLIKTNLSNPTYSLVQLPNSTNKVVKPTDESPKGLVTVMASFYVSPVILFESWFGKKKIPFYKMTGRSFLDDHKIYERFYPTVGVTLNGKAFDNFIYGINWEIARGLSLFGGFHTGKVNTFSMPNFQPNITPVTSQEFEFYQNTKWKTNLAFGVKLDIMIVKYLFGSILAQ